MNYDNTRNKERNSCDIHATLQPRITQYVTTLKKTTSIFIIYRKCPFRWCICLPYDSRGDYIPKKNSDRSPIREIGERPVILYEFNQARE